MAFDVRTITPCVSRSAASLDRSWRKTQRLLSCTSPPISTPPALSQGNRTPHTDPLSRGALVGLTLKHTRAHVFRGLIEAVAFGTEAVLEAMRGAGYG